MFAFYLVQKLGYFLLATAFLVIYLVTMYSFITGRRKTVEVFANGLRVGRTSALWTSVSGIDDKGVVDLADGSWIEIPQSIYERDALIARLRANLK